MSDGQQGLLTQPFTPALQKKITEVDTIDDVLKWKLTGKLTEAIAQNQSQSFTIGNRMSSVTIVYLPAR